MESNTSQSNTIEFQLGQTVVYGSLGKCTIDAIESRIVGGQSMIFYKISKQKFIPTKPKATDPAIWVPVANAKKMGLRAPATADHVQGALDVIASDEYYISTEQNWSDAKPKVEALLRGEGFIGLAKAVSFLYVFTKRQIAPIADANRMNESLFKQLAREIAEASGQQQKDLENKFERQLRAKLATEH
jgi:RNA polymerase-interacting CarD/CdnL/TRCF family regulator